MEKPDLVERRLKYIQRQIELDKGVVNVKFRGTISVNSLRSRLRNGSSRSRASSSTRSR
jgi:hypothetical protein